MSSLQKTFRRNFIVAVITHVVVIVGLVVWEEFIPRLPKAAEARVELVVPADILGELPQGPGHGRGAYTPPPPAPAPTEAGHGTEAVMPTPPDERMAPAPTPAPTPAPQPGEIGIPRRTTKPVKPTPTPTRTATATKTVKPTPTRSTSGSATGTAKGPTSDQIRQRFLSALRSSGAEGGTPNGDNRPAGGGTGRGKIGSPDGSVDGVVGGIGPGSPNWQYYLHVHDRMYEAWEQPGSVNDRKLMAVVTIKVARDGSIVSATIKRSSGNKAMDNSALAAARKVQMLEPPPDVLVKGSAAEISVEFQMEG